jgi:hypothetical protein
MIFKLKNSSLSCKVQIFEKAKVASSKLTRSKPPSKVILNIFCDYSITPAK